MRLKDYLVENGIKGSWFAEQIPCSSAHLSSIATGRYNPSRVIIFRINQLTNGQVTAEDFKKDDE